MSLADKLRFFADKVDELETLEIEIEDLKGANRELRNENEYMRDLLRQLGIDDIWGDFTVKSLSVADVMAIEKALQTVRV